MDAMKMEHVIQAPERRYPILNAELNTAIFEHHLLIILTPGEVSGLAGATPRFRIWITSDLTLPKRLRGTPQFWPR